ncbi:hypothetical protein HDR60_02340 [bacterium]|nr:hypothetical protein [bacterium]
MYIVDDKKVYTKRNMFKNIDKGLKKCIIVLSDGQIDHKESGDIYQHIDNMYRAVNVVKGKYYVIDNGIGLQKFAKPLDKKLRFETFDYLNNYVNLQAINEFLVYFKNKQAEKKELKDFDIVIFNKHLDTLRVINNIDKLYDFESNVFIRNLKNNSFDSFYKNLFEAKPPRSNGIKLAGGKSR